MAMWRRRIATATSGIMLAMTGLLLGAAPAGADGPIAITCGAVLRQNAYLAADLTCPTGNGVTAAASLSIDLQGHHLTGSAAGVGITVRYPANVKVTHGRLTGWGTGLTTVATRPGLDSVAATITVIAVTFLGNGIGIAPGNLVTNGESTPTYTVYRSWFLYNGIGVGGIVGNTLVKVSGATFRNNRTAVSMVGDDFTWTGGITVADSEVRNNGVGVFCTHSFCDLERNGFSSNPTAVRTADFFTVLLMTGNTVTGSAQGADLHDNFESDLDSNTFTGNKTAVSYSDGAAGRVEDNSFSGNGAALRMDHVSDGFGDTDYPVTGNRVSNNTGDGIVISNSDVVLKDNISTFNHGWGINASGAVDQGGNRAFGNYRSPQCVGVVCTH